MNTSWGIVGLGWLGTELANELEKMGHTFWGTHSNEFDFLKDTFPSKFYDVLFLNTPPLPQMSARAYVAKINKVPGSKLIFISSTSVYGNTAGFFTESSNTAPATESARWLVDVETLLMKTFTDDLTIIRPGGLMGGQRHPIFSLSRKNIIADAEQVINLIHRRDLIKICITAATAQHRIINAVAPFHPTKKDYYSQWAEKLNLPALTVSGGIQKMPRQIDSEVLPILYTNWICPKLDFL